MPRTWIGSLLAAAVLTLAAGATAAAADHNVQAGLSLTPAATSVGTPVTVSATATNITSSTISQVSMGVDIPSTLRYTRLVRPAGAACRATFVTNHLLVYCSLSLAAGQTATMTLTIVPTTTGAFTLRSYARQTYTTNDTYAYATLQVS